MVDNAVNHRCGGEGIFEDLLPLREDERDARDGLELPRRAQLPDAYPPEDYRSLAAEYPWLVLAAGAGLGLLAGALLPRKAGSKLGGKALGLAAMAGELGLSLAAQARVMADAGCQCVYVVDSAGALVLDEVSDRVAALVAELGDDAQVGFHAHRNLSVGVANTIFAIRAGASQVDGSLRALGAGAGNAQTEAIAAVCERLGIRTGIDVPAIIDAAEDVVDPIMSTTQTIDRDAITLGRAGVYSSFLAHARRIGDKYGVSPTALLTEAGSRGLVGGQEDLLVDIAVAMSGVDPAPVS